MTASRKNADATSSGNRPTYLPPEMGSRLARATMRLGEALTRVAQLEAQAGALERHLAQVQDNLQRIHASHGWSALRRYYRLRNFVFPLGSPQRALGVRLMATLKKLKSAVKGTAGATRADPEPAERECPPAPLASSQEAYARWIENHEPTPAELARQRETVFASPPRISLLVVINHPVSNLAALLEAVRLQTYSGWELCLAVPEERVAWLNAALRQAGLDPGRCRVTGQPGGASFAQGCNAALAAATGDYVAVVGPEDTLAPFALFAIVQAIHQHDRPDFLYSDEDCLSVERRSRQDPWFKPEWSPDTLRSHHYIGALAVLAHSLIQACGGCRGGFPGAELYDLTLRATERARAIVHIPQVLYHRGPNSRSAAPEAGHERAGAKLALEDHLGRLALPGEVKDGLRPDTYQVQFTLPSSPLVSIIIPSKDHADMLARCLDAIAKSTYRRYEIIIVENASRQPETFAYYRTLEDKAGIKILCWEHPFNYAAINNYAVRQAAGEVLLFLNNDTQAINPDWLERMLEHALRPGVGGVGAMLYYPDDTIQHGGIILLKSAVPVHLHRFAPRTSPGYGNRLVTVQNLSAVTGACFMTPRAIFNEVGGFDERFALLYNDVDLCLKLRQKGYLVVWTPFARLYHFESVSRDYEGVVQGDDLLFYEKWAKFFQPGDPYFSPNLKIDGPEGSIRL